MKESLKFRFCPIIFRGGSHIIPPELDCSEDELIEWLELVDKLLLKEGRKLSEVKRKALAMAWCIDWKLSLL
jgi:hypothetical protein